MVACNCGAVFTVAEDVAVCECGRLHELPKAPPEAVPVEDDED